MVRYTRFGKSLELLQTFYTFLPKKGNPEHKKGNFLDGEIWFGRGQYSFAYMLLAGSEGDYWQYFRYFEFLYHMLFNSLILYSLKARE
jgi:hypothetical protein